jgi:ankyrin repeat protein
VQFWIDRKFALGAHMNTKLLRCIGLAGWVSVIAWLPRPSAFARDFFDACEKGSPDEVAAMIKAGAHLNASDDEGETALMRAAGHNPNPAVTEVLVKAGADVNAKSKSGFTPLMEGVMSEKPKLEVLALLLKAGADVNAEDDNGDTALALAAVGDLGDPKNSKLDVVTALINSGVTANARSRALFRAAQMNEDPAVIAALVKGVGDVNFKDGNGVTPLMVAASWNPPAVSALLEAGADVNARSEDHSTALMRAAEHRRVNVVVALMKAGADVNAKSEHGLTPLMHAADDPDPDVVAALLKAGADVNAKSDDGSTALMHAAGAKLPRLDVTKALLKAGADINAQDQKGETAVDIARASHDRGMEAVLIEAGAKEK